MTATHWMQVAALALVLGLTGAAIAGAAIANDTDGTTSSENRAGASTYGMDTPSSGAIVTPEDKAVGMGEDNEHARNRNGDGDDDAATSNEDTSNDGELSVNPGPSNNEQLSINPRPDTDDASPREGATASPSSMTDRDNASRLDEDAPPPRTGSDVHPRDMGPGKREVN